MKDIKEFFSNIFESDLWPARWHCGYWSDFHGWLYIISDLSIWAAYFTIPIIIMKYVLQKKHSVRFEKAYFWFAAFILACGFTHLLDASIFWIPMYRLSALVRFVTSIISWLTVYHLIKILPKAFSLKTSEQLEEEVRRRETVLRELEISNSKFKTQNEFIEKIFDSTIDHINVFDLQLNLISINKITENFLGKPKSELIGKNFNDLFPTTINSEYYKDLQMAISGKKILNKISQSPNKSFYNTTFIPLNENQQQYAVLVISRDVTKSVIKEKELSDKNLKLQRAIDELEQFAYVLSHDLQEPLRKIQTFSNIVIDKGDLVESKTYLQKIDGSAKRMKNLIQDVLDYSKVNNKNEIYKTIVLNKVLENVKVDLELMIGTKQAIIISESLPEIKGIEYQINQVFYNLVGNAIKYSVNVPEINISCRIIKTIDKNRSSVEIRFKDNGIGFDEKYKDEIFTPFKRLQNSRDYEGTGIGLALVKKIIEGHQGTITAESKLGNGSTFTIVLPLE